MKTSPTSFRLTEASLAKLAAIQEATGARSRIEALEKAIDVAHTFFAGKAEPESGAGEGVTIRIRSASGVEVVRHGKGRKAPRG